MSGDDPGVTGSNTTLLAAVTAANFAQFGSRIVISPFVLVIVATFGTSKAEIGAALTGMWAAVALLQFPGGLLADKYGEKRVILTSMGLTMVGSALVATAPTFPVFVLAVIAVGIGAGLYFPVGTALLTRRVRRRGRAFGLHSAGGPFAGLVLPVVATAVALRYDWRAGIAVGGVVAALAFGLIARTVEPTPPTAPDVRIGRQLHPRHVLGRLSRPRVLFTTLLAVCGMYAFQAFVSFFPAFLQEFHGLSRGASSLAMGVGFLLIAVVMPAVGHVGDRTDTDLAIAVPMLVAAFGLGLLLFDGGTAVFVAGALMLGTGLTWGGALQSRFMREFADHERGTGFGLVRTLMVLLGSVGNLVTGVLADVAGWPAAMGVVVALLVGAAGLVVGNRLGGFGL